MRARYRWVGKRWFALSASRGWPWYVLKFWCNRNEQEYSVWHVGIIALGGHLEFRAGTD